MKKPFDIGLYTFKRRVMGLICPEDDQQMKDGAQLALLHPVQTVDPSGIYCFAVDKQSGDTKTLCRKNLRFNKVITLSFERTDCMTSHEETWAKLNATLKYLQAQDKQLELVR